MFSDRTLGMSDGFNNSGIVIGRNEGNVSKYNAPEKISNTEILGCSNVTKVGDVSSMHARIGGGGAMGSPSQDIEDVADRPARKGQKVKGSAYTAGMTGGFNERGMVIGVNKGQCKTHNAPEKISNTKICDSTNVTAVDDVTADTVTLEGGGAGIPPQAKKVKKDLKQFSLEEIQDMLKGEKFDADVVRIFRDKGIDGKYFRKLNGQLLEELGIKSALDRMKIETLIEHHS